MPQPGLQVSQRGIPTLLLRLKQLATIVTDKVTVKL